MAPLIAVTSRVLDQVNAGDGFRENLLATPRTYIDAVQRAGAIEATMLSLPLDDEQIHARLDRVDGLVLTGGGDVDPSRYGQAAHEAVYGVSDDRDAFELAIVRAAVDRGLPTLAICRGIQVLNVALGGTLVQHLADVPGIREHRGGVLHEVVAVAGSRVRAALGAERAIGLSWHHQALDRVADGLVVTARADDGTVEAVEVDGDAWIVGVQWHPEDTAATDPVQQRLFDTFVEQASRRTARIPG
jgi:putative glutamine amidotransferase